MTHNVPGGTAPPPTQHADDVRASASSFQSMPDPYEEAQRLKEARDALLVQGSLTSMAVKYGPLLVMGAVRNWLDFMDKQSTLIDGPGCGSDPHTTTP